MSERTKGILVAWAIVITAVGGSTGMAGVAYWVAHTEYKTDQPANVAPIPVAPPAGPVEPRPVQIPSGA